MILPTRAVYVFLACIKINNYTLLRSGSDICNWVWASKAKPIFLLLPHFPKFRQCLYPVGIWEFRSPLRWSVNEMTDSGVSNWVRWQTPICAWIIIAPLALAFWAIKMEVVVYCDDLWKPRWRKLGPLWLFFYRAFAFFFLFCLLYKVVALDGIFAFYFYTQ